jgi:hypothetical protein
MKRRQFLWATLVAPVAAALRPAGLPVAPIADLTPFLVSGFTVSPPTEPFILGIRRRGDVTFTVDFRDLTT